MGGCLLVGACVLYDADHPCGDDELYLDGYCVCGPGTGVDDDDVGCVPCGENEEGVDGLCVCEVGYSRSEGGGPCLRIPPGLGTPCDTEGAPCDDEVYDTCITTDGTSGYCTSSGCLDSEDCEGGYACELDAEPSYCRRPPTGLDEPCESHEDCEGYEAAYCDTMYLHECLVIGCSTEPDDCFEGLECCDLASFGVDETVCLEVGLCPAS